MRLPGPQALREGVGAVLRAWTRGVAAQLIPQRSRLRTTLRFRVSAVEGLHRKLAVHKSEYLQLQPSSSTPTAGTAWATAVSSRTRPVCVTNLALSNPESVRVEEARPVIARTSPLTDLAVPN